MRLGWPIIGLIALIGAAGFWLLSDIARDQDDAYVQSTQKYMGQSVDGMIKANGVLTSEYSVWDDAFHEILVKKNDDWTKTNYFTLSSSVLAVYHLNDGMRYLYINKEFEDTRAVLQDAVPRLAQTKALFSNPLDPHSLGKNAGAKLMLVGGRLAAVSVHPLQPEPTSELRRDYVAAEKANVVSITFFDEKNINQVGASFGLENPRLHVGLAPSYKSPTRVTLPIMNYTGNPVAYIDWQHIKPGTTAYEKRIAPILIGLFLTGLLTILITQKIVSANLNLLTKARSAEEANRTKSAFLASVSHELRTPLNTIIGYSEMIEEESQDAGHVQTAIDAQKVTNSAQHLLALINDLLDHSKIEAGKMDLNPTETAIAPLLTSVVEAVKSHVSKNGNTLILTCDRDIGNGWLDGMRLKQCLLNLLSNASKFTHDGTITLEVSAQVREGTDELVLKVSDTGLGMTQDTMSRLFTPFVQADEKVAARFGGTGLGLVITKALIVAMGGSVNVESSLGVGSIFTIIVPRGAMSKTQAYPLAA
jgi:signal transduction histidine kinase